MQRTVTAGSRRVLRLPAPLYSDGDMYHIWANWVKRCEFFYPQFVWTDSLPPLMDILSPKLGLAAEQIYTIDSCICEERRNSAG